MNTDVIRKPAVAGMFYPRSEEALNILLADLMNQTKVKKKYENIFGIVAPHAGYIYSGLTAAYAYNVVRNNKFSTAIIISPSHREFFHGSSIYNGDYFSTPLGLVEIDSKLRKTICHKSKSIFEGEVGHNSEHAVEVHIPFLQFIQPDIKILPIVIGDQRKEFIYELADSISNIYNDKILVIASSDLSHFYSKDIARRLDHQVEERIINFEFDELLTDLNNNACEACGGGAIIALMKAAASLGFTNTDILSKTDSGDFSGDNSSVVGYLSAVIYK